MRRRELEWLGRGVASSILWALGVASLAQAPPASAQEEPRLSAREEKFRDEHIKVLEKGSSTRAARQTALRDIPLDKLTPEDRAVAQKVLDNISVFRAMPNVEFEVDHEVYKYFLNAPEAAVAIWRTMGISKFKLSPTEANQYIADCGDGTSGKVRMIYHTDEKCVLLCDGVFKNPFLAKPVVSQCLLSLDTKFYFSKEGRPYARHHAALFVSFPSQTVETAAKMISPVSNVVLDHNFREISLFLHMMFEVMRKQPGWVEKTVDNMDGVVETRKQELLKLTARVYLQNRKRELAQDGDGDVTVDEVLAPLREASAEGSTKSSGGVVPATGRPRIR